MKIKTITVGNYKNIGPTTLELGQIVALVSINNYGKSNLLEAIDFGFDYISASPKGRRQMMSYVKNIPLSRSLAGSNYSFQIEFDEPELGEYRFVRYGFEFTWRNDKGTGARIVDETLEIRSNESTRYTSYLKRGKGAYRASKAKTGFRKLELADNVLAIDIVSSVERAEIAKVVTFIKELKYRICDSLEVDNSFSVSPIEIDLGQGQEFPFNDEDIPRALSVLQKEDPSRFNLFLEAIYDLFPEFNKVELQEYTLKENLENEVKTIKLAAEDGKEQEIPYRLRNDLFSLMIESSYLNQPLSMENMSTGTKRIFWLVANAIFSNSSGTRILGVDEIETSIHPRMIERLLSSLIELLGDTSLLVTSHSPYLIQYLKPQSIYIGSPSNDGVARFKRVAPGKAKALVNAARERSLSVGEYIFELISGDEDSADILSAYLEG